MKPGEANGEREAFAAAGQSCGLTKREEFAKAAMTALIGSPSISPPSGDGNPVNYAAYARGAVMAADALLAELAKPRDGQ